MAYGKIKADAVIWDNSGSDVEESMSNIAGKLNASGGAMTGNLTLNAQNELRLADSDSSNYIALKSPATVASNVTLTLPNTDGDADQYLQTNGSGVLSWASVSGGFTWSSKTAYSSGMIFTGIPSTTTEMVILFNEITNSSNTIRIQLGTSSAFTSTGYISHEGYYRSASSASNRYTNGIHIYASNHTQSGLMHFYRGGTSGDSWHYSSNLTMWDGSNAYNEHSMGRVEVGSSYSLNRIILENMSGGGDGGHVTLGYK